jgi:hypothetical protein
VAAASDVPPSVTRVRPAIPVVFAYGVRHHGYRGNDAREAARDRLVDPRDRRSQRDGAVVLRREHRTAVRPQAGPRADIRTGHCGERGEPVVIP